MKLYRLIGLLFFLCGVLEPQLRAQAPLDEVLGIARREGVPWVLAHSPEDAPRYAAQGDEILIRLGIEHQLARLPLSARASLDLGQKRGWGSQGHWLLVSSRGEEIGEGSGLASGEKVLALLQAKRLVPGWEARRVFLKRHPDNGDAWMDEVLKASMLAESRMEVLLAAGKASRGVTQVWGLELPSATFREPDPQVRGRQADKVFCELAEALGGVRALRTWWHELFFPAGRIFACGGAESPRLREVCGGLAQDLERALERNGPDIMLEQIWPMLRILAGTPIQELPAVISPPGGDWPPMLLLSGCLETFTGRKDWEGALALLDGLPHPDPIEPWTPQSWNRHKEFQGFLAYKRVLPLLELGRTEEARKYLEDARSWAGSGWGLFGRDSLLVFGPRVSGEKIVQELLQSPALPDPPMPPPIPPFRLALLGKAPWRLAWQRLRDSKELLPWGPGELQWSALSPGEAAALKTRGGWDSEPRWVILAGDDLLGTGLQCPRPEALAATLEQRGPSRLQRLNAFLERNPERLDVRRTRFDLLKTRMPEPRLEELMAEDARMICEPDPQGAGLLDFGPDAPWKPKVDLWQWSSQQVLPRIEAGLRSWPQSRRLWEGWLAWARFHPANPSVAALANSLTLWRPRATWVGNLPPEVHRAMADELRKDRNYLELARWLGDAWAAVDKTPPSQLDPPDSWEYLKPEREKLHGAIVAPLAEALRFLKREGEAKAVEATYAEMMKR